MAQILKGQVALVTGGGRGIGRAIAEKLASEGASVVVAARTDRQLKEVVAAIEKSGGRAFAVTCDVTNRADVERTVKVTQEKFGPITFLVNNAGQGGPFGPIGVVDPDAWWQAQAVHVRGPMLFMSAVLPGMKERKRGRVLNICSIGGVLKSANISAYGVGKSAEIALTERVDVECREHGVRAFAVQPGTIITDMAKDTLNDPAAQRYVPFMLDMLRHLNPEQSARDMQRCTEYAAQIAAGKYDMLAGRYIDFGNDLDALAKHVRGESSAAPPSPEQDRLERNKQTVLAFYEAAINQKDFDTASKYMSPHYKQHNPTAADGPEGLKTWLAEFKRMFPNLRAEIKHVVAEGDFVALHVYGVNGPSPHGTAVVDLFRLKDGLLAEHWDVIQPIPPEASNSNSMF